MCVCVCSAKEKDRRGHLLSLQGQRGILSCFAAHPTSPSLMAAGAFNGDGELDGVPVAVGRLQFAEFWLLCSRC